jgi:hypothetical protein
MTDLLTAAAATALLALFMVMEWKLLEAIWLLNLPR